MPEVVERVSELSASVNMDTATVVLQLFDNSVYMAGGPGGEKRLPSKDRSGTYHIDGSLVVADKAVIKDLVNQILPLLKVLGSSRKIVLTPMARYWVAPCCSDPTHTVNYHTVGFLPCLGDAITSLRDSIRDALFVKKVQNFRVLCSNRMIEVGQRRQEPSDEEVAKAAALWGLDPIHPTSAAYRVIAKAIEEDLRDTGARYTNPARGLQISKRPRYDPSQDWAGWVSGCSAATPRSRHRAEETPLVVEAGRLHTGGSVPTTGAAPRVDPITVQPGETASGNSRVVGEDGASRRLQCF